MATSTFSASAVIPWKASRPGRVASVPGGRRFCLLVHSNLPSSDLIFSVCDRPSLHEHAYLQPEKRFSHASRRAAVLQVAGSA